MLNKTFRCNQWSMVGVCIAFMAILMNLCKNACYAGYFQHKFIFLMLLQSVYHNGSIALHALALCQMKTYNIQQLTNILTKVSRYAADSCSL